MDSEFLSPTPSSMVLKRVIVQPTGAPSPHGTPSGASSSSSSNANVDPKRPYGGLVPSQPKGTRAYQDAASYNQHLAQHQAYTAQAQAASQAAQNVYRNPYLQPASSQSSYSGASDSTSPNFPPQQQFSTPSSQTSSHRGLTHQTSHGHLNVNTNVPQYSGQATAGPGGFTVPQHMNPPGQSYYSTARTRSNTIHNVTDNIPPALARLQHMNQEVIGGRKALTPVLKRDDALKEWERRQQGKVAAAQPYPQLEFLQQQAELAAAQGLTNWGHASGVSTGRGYPTSSLAHSYQPNAMVVDEDRRDVILSGARNAAGHGASDPASNLFATASGNLIPSPPQAYTSNSTTTGNRYAATYSQQGSSQGPTSPFDGTIDRRGDLGAMYVPMQPDQYGPYNPGSSSSSGNAPRQVAPPQQAVPPSFYGAGVVPAGAGHAMGNNQQRNPFAGADGQPSTKEQRRKSGMELWSQ